MRKGDAKRQAILDTAQRLFFQKGFEQTSVQDILDVLSCSKGSFYHHFESKLSVLETLCGQRAEAAAEKARRLMALREDVTDQLNLLFYCLFPLRRGEEAFMSLLLPMTGTKEGTSLHYQYAKALAESFEPLMDAVLLTAKASGVCHPVRLEGMSALILDMYNQCWQKMAGAVMAHVSSREPLEPAEFLPLLNLYRGSVERLLDAPYGSMIFVELEEVCQACAQVLNKLRLEM